MSVHLMDSGFYRYVPQALCLMVEMADQCEFSELLKSSGYVGEKLADKHHHVLKYTNCRMPLRRSVQTDEKDCGKGILRSMITAKLFRGRCIVSGNETVSVMNDRQGSAIVT